MKGTGLRQYLPALGMVLATVLGVGYTALQDNSISATEFFMIMTSLCGAVSTYIVPRVSTHKWLKPAVAALTAAVNAGAAAIVTPGISMQEWVMIGIQVLVGLGIVASTNANVPLTAPGEPLAIRRQASG